MSKQLLRNTLTPITNKLSTKEVSTSLGNNSCKRKIHTNEIPVREIKIPVHWGHIAAKLWGDSNERPILALHGWQDNAGTWDPLIPLLKTGRPILAIDFPGHGLSSWLPAGTSYDWWLYIRLIYYIKYYFKWEKVTFLCHSLGSFVGITYTSLFPDHVDLFIAVENIIQAGYAFKPELILKKIAGCIEKRHKLDEKLGSDEPRYSYEDMIKMYHEGTLKQLDLENVHHILKRGCKKSEKYPNTFTFTRDPRLKYDIISPDMVELSEAKLKNIKCPVLYIQGKDTLFAADKISVYLRSVLLKNNNKCELILMSGTHFVHLNNADEVAPVIDKFLLKHSVKSTSYDWWLYIRLIYYIKYYFKWEKVTFLCHSLGSFVGITYTSLFPDHVDLFIAVENIVHAGYAFNPELILKQIAGYIEKRHKLDEKLGSEEPRYSYDNMIKLYHEGTLKQLDLENVHHILKRGCKESEKYPNTFTFTRDPRLKYDTSSPDMVEFSEAKLKNITCPVLYIKGKDTFFATDKISVYLRNVLLKNNNKCELVLMPGTHFVHLNNADEVAPVIDKFLLKHSVKSKL